MSKERLVLNLKIAITNKNYSASINDYRVGGMKWNDVGSEKNSLFYKIGLNKEDLLFALGVDKQIADLEAKLAESEKSKESFKVMYFNKCLDYEHLHEKFNDKCAEFELKEYDYKQTIFEKDQDKISFAVEQLEKVKELVEEKSMTQSPFGTQKIYANDVSAIIDSQIKAIKGEK